MTLQNYYSDYHESYEYHGNTAIEVTREKDGMTIKRDWIFFDSVQEAQDFFYENYQTEDTMFDRIIDGLLDFVFMVMILILSILGTLVVGM